MARYAAFLRAINVGGHIVKMDALRALCGQCGLSNVETVIASGNVIFDSRAAAPALEKKIEAHLQKSLGYEVATFVRSVEELEPVVSRAHKALGEWKNVQAFTNAGERFAFSGREMYWIVNAGVSDAKFSYAALERILKSPATFRNVNTVRKIGDKYA